MARKSGGVIDKIENLLGMGADAEQPQAKKRKTTKAKAKKSAKKTKAKKAAKKTKAKKSAKKSKRKTSRR